MNYRRVMQIPAPETVAAAPAEMASVLARRPAQRHVPPTGWGAAR